MSTNPSNVTAIAQKLANIESLPPDQQELDLMWRYSELVTPKRPVGLIGGVDSSDNLLLNIPDHPGAAIAGYSFSLVVSDPDGVLRFVNDRLLERAFEEYIEPLEIALIYSSPLPAEKRVLYIADYQLRVLINTPSSRSPYDFDELLPEFKVRMIAARHRETIERRAVRTSLFQSELDYKLLLKDGRHSSQNVSTRYTDDVGRRAVERGVRYVGVVKQGTLLWTILYPYHRELYERRGGPYWTLVSPNLIFTAYNSNQVDTKTLRLGAHENQSLGGIGGAWVLYGNSKRTFYVLEFNVYDLASFRPLVDTGMPLDIFVQEKYRWPRAYVVHEHYDALIGTQTAITDQDLEQLIVPTVSEVHHLAMASRVSPGYPIVLADAHDRCKITGERKDRLNAELIVALQKQGLHPVDFETWTEDPHKMFER
jgi:hypothetical protein